MSTASSDDSSDLIRIEFWGSVASALGLSCLRTYGQTGLAALEYEGSRRDLAALLPGLVDQLESPSGAAQSVARAAALVHAANVSVGRSSTVVSEGPEKTWVIEWPPGALSDGPFAPSTAMATASSAVGMAWSKARAEAVVRELGIRDVLWVHTQDQTNGDPVNAGYFSVAPVSGSAYRWEPRTGLPEVLPPQELVGGESLSMELTAENTLRRVAHRIDVLVEQYGEVDGRAVIELAFRTIMIGRWGWLAGELLGSPVRTPRDAADLYAGLYRITTTTVGRAEELEPGLSVFRAPGQWPDVDLWQRCSASRDLLQSAWVDAWTAAARQSAMDLRVRRTYVSPDKADLGGDVEFLLAQ
jgi:hypothetical protein